MIPTSSDEADEDYCLSLWQCALCLATGLISRLYAGWLRALTPGAWAPWFTLHGFLFVFPNTKAHDWVSHWAVLMAPAAAETVHDGLVCFQLRRKDITYLYTVAPLPIQQGWDAEVWDCCCKCWLKIQNGPKGMNLGSNKALWELVGLGLVWDKINFSTCITSVYLISVLCQIT